MNFATLQPLLLAWVKALTGLDVAVFQNEPRPRHNGTLVLLSWVSNTSVGIDDLRWEITDDPIPALNATATVSGCRRLALQVSIENLDQRPATHAQALCEKLRARTRLPSSLALIKAMELGLVSVGDVRQADYKVDQHWVSRALVEFRFNASSFEADIAVTSIETVEVTSQFEDVDGTVLPDALQLIATVFPQE